MKRFIIQTILFGLSAILVLFLFGTLINSTRTKMVHVEDNVHIAFFGNSQIESSINDTIVQGAFNWARSFETPEFVYAKIKLLKKCNPQIDTVFIGFDNVLTFHSDREEFPYRICHPYLYDMYTIEDWFNILKNSEQSRWINYFIYPYSWEKMKDYRLLGKNDVTTRDWNDLGGYVYLTRNKLEEHRKRYTYKPHDLWKCSKNAYYFLDKSIEFCKDNNIQLVFICAPQHKEHQQNTESYRTEYAEHYSQIPFYDYVSMELPDSCFADLNHLNYKGAKVFSRFINEQIRQ